MLDLQLEIFESTMWSLLLQIIIFLNAAMWFNNSILVLPIDHSLLFFIFLLSAE
jgi:hypothetical protein